MSVLSGPRLVPQGDVRSLIVLCHGYGASGDDLMGLARHWRTLLPTTAFCAPHGPQPCPSAQRQWFPMGGPQEITTGLRLAATQLDAFISQELTRFGLSPHHVALVGFSQGTILSLFASLSTSSSFSPWAVVGYSGTLASPISQSVFPPLLLVHGEADPLIPAESLIRTVHTLSRAGAAAQWHLSPGLGHAIDRDGLDLGGAFLAAHTHRGLS